MTHEYCISYIVIQEKPKLSLAIASIIETLNKPIRPKHLPKIKKKIRKQKDLSKHAEIVVLGWSKFE